MQYTKIVGTFLNFKNGQRIKASISYSSQENQLEDTQIVIRTYENSRVIQTILNLEGSDLLDFVSQSDDPRIPVIKGRFLNSDYLESHLSASLPDQGIRISGVVARLNPTQFVSVKTITEISTGQVSSVLQEQIELISESEFQEAIKSY